LRKKYPSFSAARIVDQLCRTVKMVGPYLDSEGPNGTEVFATNPEVGFGQVNAEQALDYADVYVRDGNGDGQEHCGAGARVRACRQPRAGPANNVRVRNNVAQRNLTVLSANSPWRFSFWVGRAAKDVVSHLHIDATKLRGAGGIKQQMDPTLPTSISSSAPPTAACSVESGCAW